MNKMKILTYLFGFFVLFVSNSESKNCKISEAWADNSFTLFTSNNFQPIYPPPPELSPPDRVITIGHGKTIIVSCKNGHFYNTGNFSTSNNLQTFLVTCNQNGQFEIQDQIVDLSLIYCSNFRPIDVITYSRCSPVHNSTVLIGLEMKIGLNIARVPVIDVCFDLEKKTPLFVYFNITKSIGNIKSYLTTLYDDDTSFYNLPGLNFTKIYDLEYQKSTINELLGLESNSSKYVDLETCHPSPGGLPTTPGFCLTMRPLAFKGNFVYIPQQFSVFHQVNVVPQWSFLTYNLDKAMWDVINYAKTNKKDLEVFVGTFGIATIPHESTGEETELFLYVENKIEAIPVPLLFWQIVYDKQEKKAIGLVTINDPHGVHPSKDNVICEDISEKINWLTWESQNVTKGYSYACSYEEMRDKIGFLPYLYVEGVLE